LAGRRVFASDLSPYAYALTHAKLNAPHTLDAAVHQIETLLEESAASATPDLRAVPRWVRAYFNPRTLKEAISFSNVCQDRISSHIFAAKTSRPRISLRFMSTALCALGF
jgi:hypothetical protein